MSATEYDIMQEAEEIRRKRLDALGLGDQYDLWRESMPNGRDMSDQEVYNTFLEAQGIEQAALDGRVSVSTGATDEGPATTIPAVGTDDEDTGPDAAGKVSEGAPEDTGEEAEGATELKEVEGIWFPPEESEALNYIEPTTDQMSRTPDWIENARVLHKAMGSPNPATAGQPRTTPLTPPEDEIPSPEMTDEQIGQWARRELSMFNWNVASTVSYAHKIMSSDDPKLAVAFLNLINMYDHSDGGGTEFARALLGIATDPTTYVGFGIGSVAAKGAARATAKAGLKKAVQMALIGGTAGAVEGGSLAGGFDLVVQNVEQEAGVRKDIDLARTAVATGVGTAAGATLGGGGGALVGRRMDKLAKMHDDIQRLVEGTRIVEEERAAKGISDTELLEMLETSRKMEKLERADDEAAAFFIRYMEENELPRNADGTIDTDALDKAFQEWAAKRRGVDTEKGEKILPGREGGKPLTVEEGLARGLDDEIIAKLEQDPVNVADKLERAGFKITMGEEGDILFRADVDDMSPATVERIERVAKETGVTVEPTGIPNKDGTVTPYVAIRGDPVDLARFGDTMAGEVIPARLPMAESRRLALQIAEMEKTAAREVVAKTASLPGSRVRDVSGAEFEVMGRTKNGWYHLSNKLTGEEVNRRRNQFEVLESRPRPTMAGPMELKPFTTSAARIIAMNEDVVSGKLEKVKITTAEQRAIVGDLRKMGIDITEKSLSAHWTPAELLFLRDTYNAQAKGIHDLARVLGQELRNNGRLTDQQMAMFNEAHTQFVVTRDLFYGVSGNAARQLQILKSRPTDEVYEFSQAIMDSLSISGGRVNTERAITTMAEFAEKGLLKPGQTRVGAITRMSENIWGNKAASAFLILRYNMMLSSWRTHWFNFLGNSASGVYAHLIVSPVNMLINNMAYARNLARAVIDPKYAPDPADRLTRHQWYAELRSHFSSARDSFMLAKEIALGRDIGEGKVWNELGLRYNVINVPDTAFGKIGTTPVRLLEAGDAFFKNQYYMAKVHQLSSIKARADSIHKGLDYETQYRIYVDDPDAPMQRMAKDFAAKQTYTNDPNVYGGILAALARGAATAQNRNLAVNMILPFVRTPANLLSFSMEMIGANVILAPNKTYNAIMKGTAAESQEAIAKLTVAAGLWLMVHEMYQNGDITGTGPSNWEERKVWEAAGWQANSIKVYGNWVNIARADPAGQSLVAIASVFDFYAMTRQQRKPAMEWIGAGLLYTADMLVDESYLSTVSDVITAIASKEEARARSVTASLINSVVVPNLLRDIRRATDETRRTGASENTLDQVVKQMKNASPWLSEDLPPSRDWKGDPVNYYGNAYVRALIPFDIRNPEDSDPASMALAYARIPVSTPNRTIEWPKGQGDAIDLFAMDKGEGFVYDKYVEIAGKARLRVVNEAMRTPIWKRLVKDNNMGPGSDGENVLRRAIAIGSRIGRDQMLNFLIKHSGDNNSFRRGNGDLIIIHHPVSVQEYKMLRRMVRGQDIPVPEELQQYQIEERQEGPEFFKP